MRAYLVPIIAVIAAPARGLRDRVATRHSVLQGIRARGLVWGELDRARRSTLLRADHLGIPDKRRPLFEVASRRPLQGDGGRDEATAGQRLRMDRRRSVASRDLMT